MGIEIEDEDENELSQITHPIARQPLLELSPEECLKRDVFLKWLDSRLPEGSLGFMTNHHWKAVFEQCSTPMQFLFAIVDFQIHRRI